ncbi:hypothetical protein Vadar_019615 [Vaccinium darrowii]|uniref:Uncharacterized protein n=1 Tax=Vaccinium darrowii TaxID=229202 RepID=A0ACB7YWQ8_9ERIC|nr:hypothetical protein Vadar_019615 [Vaccinium darrowii]
MSAFERLEFEKGKIVQPVRLAINVASGVDSSHENSISRKGTNSDVVPFSDCTLAGASSTGWSFSKVENAIDNGVIQVEGSCRCFSLDEVLKATNNFDETYVIGIGGFGKVYQGFVDDGATIVAIKRLNVESKQGAGEFWTEVKMLSKLRHTNLVALIGYYNECEEMILVYKYISHETLANHLYQSKVLCGRLPVDERLEEDQIGLVHWAQDCIKKGKLDSIIDPSLSGQISPRCLKSFVVLANNCLHSSPKSRPTMVEVLGSLELVLASPQRGRKEGIITKAFQIMTDQWLREREGMSSSSGQSRRTMAEELQSIDLELVSQQRGRVKGIIKICWSHIRYVCPSRYVCKIQL